LTHQKLSKSFDQKAFITSHNANANKGVIYGTFVTNNHAQVACGGKDNQLINSWQSSH
jgi:hypothetical protein